MFFPHIPTHTAGQLVATISRAIYKELMNDTTNQMSLLDAIGFSAPEATKKTKKDKAAKAETADANPGGKKQGKRKVKTSEEVDTSAAAAAIAETGTAPAMPEQTGEKSAADQAAEPDVPASTAGAQSLPLDKYLCFALYSANHAMHGVYKSLLKEIGLTYPQFLAMTVLWDSNNIPVGAITSKLQLDTNTLTPLLKRLEAMDLLTRTRNSKDERQVILKLTRKGRALQKKTEHFAGCISSASGLQLEEITDLQDRIMKLRDSLRQAGLAN